MSIICIVQARIGSTRLPNKVMKHINEKPILWYCLTRLKKCKHIDKIVVATSTNKENDTIRQFCDEHGYDCFSGDEDDVLSRYYNCAKKYNAETVVRITSDCPLIDPDVVDHYINYYKEIKGEYDYIKNSWFDNSYPSGFDAMVFSFNVLQKCHESTLGEQISGYREHVLGMMDKTLVKKYLFSDIDTNLINNLNFDINCVHLSVDTQQDFDLIENILMHFKDNIDFTFTDVISYLNNNPDLTKINLDPSRLRIYYIKD
jgi:spore coat polysaccharide biosynthesis protein SpsF